MSKLWTPPHAKRGIITHAEFRVHDGDDGRCLDGWDTDNLIVDDGKSVMFGQLFGQNVTGLLTGGNFTYPAPMNSLGVGTDTTAASSTQFKLNPSVGGSVSLIAITSYTMTASTGAGAAIAVVTATWGTGVANFVWGEWGAFNGTTNGTSFMFDRSTFGTFNKTAAVSIQLTATFNQS